MTDDITKMELSPALRIRGERSNRDTCKAERKRIYLSRFRLFKRQRFAWSRRNCKMILVRYRPVQDPGCVKTGPEQGDGVPLFLCSGDDHFVLRPRHRYVKNTFAFLKFAIALSLLQQSVDRRLDRVRAISFELEGDPELCVYDQRFQ